MDTDMTQTDAPAQTSLLPCRFCGSPHVSQWSVGRTVQCNSCGAAADKSVWNGPSFALPQASEKRVICPKCGALLWHYRDGRETCSRCEYDQERAPPQEVAAWLVESSAGKEVFLYPHNAKHTAEVQRGELIPLYKRSPDGAPAAAQQITPEMVRAGAEALNPMAFELDEHGNYLAMPAARCDARSEAEAVLRAALKVPSRSPAGVASVPDAALIKLIESARYVDPVGPQENAWNDALDHISEGLTALPSTSRDHG